ncbi:MAG: lytic transglycosylase domain-containing protein [Bacillota bacterium]|nr:lytic transglycosylase domain-containing protein [Bacillota bacterium]
MKKAIMPLIIVFGLTMAIPAIASAQSNIPVIFCGPTLYSPFIKIDCSKVESKKAVKVDSRKVSLSENKTLPRSATAVRTFLGDLADGIRELIKKIARVLNMDPRILEAVARAESGGNQASISPAGAVGVMQLMPGTARGLGVNPYDLEQNILGGGMYLKRQMDRFGSLPLALAAYNAGPGAVERYGGIPPYEETRQYIANVLSMIGGD